MGCHTSTHMAVEKLHAKATLTQASRLLTYAWHRATLKHMPRL